MILSHKLHKVVVNPQILVMFKTDCDRLSNVVSEEYETWIAQDQALFTWLLSIISEVVLPRFLSCKHAYEIWNRVHQHFRARMKVIVHQLRVKLRMVKKVNKTIFEHVLRIRVIADSLLAIGDPISERDQVDSILQGLPKEYNPFIMMIYEKLSL